MKRRGCDIIYNKRGTVMNFPTDSIVCLKMFKSFKICALECVKVTTFHGFAHIINGKLHWTERLE